MDRLRERFLIFFFFFFLFCVYVTIEKFDGDAILGIDRDQATLVVVSRGV